MTDTAARTHGVSNRVLDYIAANPGSTSLDIAAALGMGGTQASAALHHLYETGRVTRQRKSKCFVYILAERAEQIEHPDATDWRNRCERAEAHAAELQADFNALQALHDELLDWKADAIAKHPDLDIDPLLLKAREIVAAVTLDLKTQEQVRVGTLDHDLGVRAVLMALRSKEA